MTLLCLWMFMGSMRQHHWGRPSLVTSQRVPPKSSEHVPPAGNDAVRPRLPGGPGRISFEKTGGFPRHQASFGRLISWKICFWRDRRFSCQKYPKIGTAKIHICFKWLIWSWKIVQPDMNGKVKKWVSMGLNDPHVLNYPLANGHQWIHKCE